MFDRSSRIFLLLIGAYYSYFYFAAYAEVPSFLWRPVWHLKALGLPAYTSMWLKIIATLFSIFCLLSALAWRTEVSTAFAFLLSLFLFPLSNSFSCFFHTENSIVVALGILALTRRDQSSKAFEDRALLLIRLVLVGLYFSAAISKILNWGLSFGFDGGAYYAVEINQFWRGANAPPLAIELREYLLERKWILVFFSHMTLAIELASPLMLLRNRIGYVVTALAFFMQLGFIVVLQFPKFIPILVLFIFMVPPKWLIWRFGHRY